MQYITHRVGENMLAAFAATDSTYLRVVEYGPFSNKHTAPRTGAVLLALAKPTAVSRAEDQLISKGHEMLRSNALADGACRAKSKYFVRTIVLSTTVKACGVHTCPKAVRKSLKVQISVA